MIQCPKYTYKFRDLKGAYRTLTRSLSDQSISGLNDSIFDICVKATQIPVSTHFVFRTGQDFFKTLEF